MNRLAFLFPGQASQYVGMGQELFERSERVKNLYRLASDLLGEDLADISFNGPAEKLKQTKFTQPGILIHSLALLEALEDHLPRPVYTAGHSLGEYAALACSGSFSYEDAVAAVCRRALLMEEACRQKPGTMAAIMALADDKLEEVCRQASTRGIVTVANINSSLQMAVSGQPAAVQEACRLASLAGAKKAVMLEVGGAFHSPLMASAAPGMADCLNHLAIKDAAPPVVANVTARPITRPEEIRKLLVNQITAPVRWRDTMTFLHGEGLDGVVEIGPGRVLAGLAKRDLPGVKIFNIDHLIDLQTVEEEILQAG